MFVLGTYLNFHEVNLCVGTKTTCEGVKMNPICFNLIHTTACDKQSRSI